MKVGVIVEGDSEFQCLPTVISRLSAYHKLVGVLRAKVDPLAPAPAIAKAITPAVRILADRRADRVILALDYETGTDCAPERAAALKAELVRIFNRVVSEIEVVIKQTKFENWLISDTKALKKLPRRFRFRQNQLDSLRNRADQVDALSMLKGAAIGDPYGKVRDSARIIAHAQPLEMAVNSRSFRRMLRVLGCPVYSTQSRNP